MQKKKKNEATGSTVKGKKNLFLPTLPLRLVNPDQIFIGGRGEEL